MAEVKKFDLDDPEPVFDDEDEETLAAIDKGIRDAEAGRTVPIEKVRKLAIRRRSPVRKLVHSPILAYYEVHEDRRVIEVLHFRDGSRKAAKIQARPSP